MIFQTGNSKCGASKAIDTFTNTKLMVYFAEHLQKQLNSLEVAVESTGHVQNHIDHHRERHVTVAVLEYG